MIFSKPRATKPQAPVPLPPTPIESSKGTVDQQPRVIAERAPLDHALTRVAELEAGIAAAHAAQASLTTPPTDAAVESYLATGGEDSFTSAIDNIDAMARELRVARRAIEKQRARWNEVRSHVGVEMGRVFTRERIVPATQKLANALAAAGDLATELETIVDDATNRGLVTQHVDLESFCRDLEYSAVTLLLADLVERFAVSVTDRPDVDRRATLRRLEANAR